ncbi:MULTISPECIES: hypothetical protein [unclassified Phenylobacterium]|jgi:hypothetical protein|uniref:hypothetical protein n=1 Tax=unclassified Phenylobacterium TaxID=2640670 RepID=UPI0006F400C9|nr:MULTISPECIES: hypothetical protein [unclassified Phenylobacterium]KQW67064.1 hypothetical protein ASC73_18230 [Phenylobacterium sp. Root1277]KQW89757.1 hypothetical protein ASC79_19135 [Phenylobacterium sp. Root1290]
MAAVPAPVLALTSLLAKARRWSLYLPAPRAWHAAGRARRIERHRLDLPIEDPTAAVGLAALRQAGFWRPDADGADMLKLSPDERADLVRRLDALKGQEATTTTIQSNSDQMSLAIYAAGLDTRLLALVERYVQTPVLYLGAAAKCERADGVAVNQRRWHTDMEDLQVVRFIVYLSPVEESDGPFEYLPAERTTEVRSSLRYRSGFLSEALADRHIPATERVGVTGEEGAVIVFDGARLFHRARPPTDRDRYSVTYSYTSRWPLELRATALPHPRLRQALAGLPHHALACLPGRV